jgi:hypothetical protein
MSLFNDVLQSLQKKISAAQGNKEEIATIVSKVLGVTVLPDQVTVKNGVLVLAVAPTIKMSLRIKAATILQKLQAEKIPIYSIA